jgi:hypothetical protein
MGMKSVLKIPVINLILVMALVTEPLAFADREQPSASTVKQSRLTCALLLTKNAVVATKNWVGAKTVQMFGAKENYYPLKMAYKILYPPTGNSPLNEHLVEYFPKFMDEMERQQTTNQAPDIIKAGQSIPDYLEVANYLINTQNDYLTDDEFGRFRDRVLYLASLRRDRGGDGRTGSAEFKKWLPGALDLYRKKTEMYRLITVNGRGHTFKSLFDVELKHRFDDSGYLTMGKTEAAIYGQLSHPAVHLPVIATWRLSKWIAGALAGIVIFSTGQDIWRAFASGPQGVVSQKSKQVGSKLFYGVTTGLQFAMIGSDTPQKLKNEQTDVKNLEQAVGGLNIRDLVGKNPDEAEKELARRMDGIRKVSGPVQKIMEEEYGNYKETLKLATELKAQEGAALPDDQNGGRYMLWDHGFGYPIGASFYIAGFETNYNSHEILLTLLTEKLERLKADPKSNQREMADVETRIAAHLKSMDVAIQQAANVVAAVKVREHMFPELYRKVYNGKDHQAISGVYLYMKSKMGLDHYLIAYEKEAHNAALEIHNLISMRRAFVEKAIQASQNQK